MYILSMSKKITYEYICVTMLMYKGDCVDCRVIYTYSNTKVFFIEYLHHAFKANSKRANR